MNNKEFQEWLKQFPDDAVIECIRHESGRGYYDQGGNASTEVFEPDMQRFENIEDVYCKRGLMTFSEYRSIKTLLIGGINE